MAEYFTKEDFDESQMDFKTRSDFYKIDQFPEYMKTQALELSDILFDPEGFE